MERMSALLRQLAPSEGYTLSALNEVKFMRSNRPMARTPVLYEPCICIVVQGRKRGYLGDAMYVYDCRHYLVLSVPLPFYTETDASADEPLLALAIRIDRTTLADLLLTMADQDADAAPLGMMSSVMDERLANTVLRLLEALSSPQEARVLGPAIVREICYRVLTGEQGGAMRAALAGQSHFGKVARALRRIHADYAADLDVALLAAEANMSVPAFHVHFKAVTQCSPIQYVKSTRLHQARLLMIRNNMSASAACTQVGYESASQFSREFKRLFGRTPGQEADFMKHSLALIPAHGYTGLRPGA
ncbi:AraC-like DNA-binding protein [Oxalobacteraceae bacterium GrIS 1.11]